MKTEIKSSSFSSESGYQQREAEPRPTHNQPQLELTFDRSTACQRNARRRRQTVASLWFRRMRQIVDNATDFRPALPPRPVQPLPGRELPKEHHLTE